MRVVQLAQHLIRPQRPHHRGFVRCGDGQQDAFEDRGQPVVGRRERRRRREQRVREVHPLVVVAVVDAHGFGVGRGRDLDAADDLADEPARRHGAPLVVGHRQRGGQRPRPPVTPELAPARPGGLSPLLGRRLEHRVERERRIVRIRTEDVDARDTVLVGQRPAVVVLGGLVDARVGAQHLGQRIGHRLPGERDLGELVPVLDLLTGMNALQRLVVHTRQRARQRQRLVELGGDVAAAVAQLGFRRPHALHVVAQRHLAELFEGLTRAPDIQPRPGQQLGGPGVNVELRHGRNPRPARLRVGPQRTRHPARGEAREATRCRYAARGLPLPQDHARGGVVDRVAQRDHRVRAADRLRQIRLVALLERRRADQQHLVVGLGEPGGHELVGVGGPGHVLVGGQPRQADVRRRFGPRLLQQDHRLTERITQRRKKFSTHHAHHVGDPGGRVGEQLAAHVGPEAVERDTQHLIGVGHRAVQ